MDGIGVIHLDDTAKFNLWLQDPGGPRVVAYHVGDLDQDRCESVDLDNRACEALAAAEGTYPTVHLTQRRLGNHQAVYLATKSLPRSGR